jgi:hypothetical protein
VHQVGDKNKFILWCTVRETSNYALWDTAWWSYCNVDKLQKVWFNAKGAQVNQLHLNVICCLSKGRVEKLNVTWGRKEAVMCVWRTVGFSYRVTIKLGEVSFSAYTAHAPHFHLWPVWPYNTYPYYLINSRFSEEIYWTQNVYLVFVYNVWTISHYKKNWVRYDHRFIFVWI